MPGTLFKEYHPIAVSVLEYFSETYQQARHKFLLACEAHQIDIRTYQNHAVTGADGEALYTDIAVIGDTGANKVLIISSGTHGVEGYCGSALQLYALEQGLRDIISHDCVCYIVHAINPYGFSYHRRVNEDNVDLNRNFIDFSQPLPDNSNYRTFKEFIHNYIQEAGNRTATGAASAYREKYGEKMYQEAITSGQYTDETDIYFGGKHATWSNVTWMNFIKRVLSHAIRVIHIDIHTGLGPYGKQTLIYTRDTSKPAFQMACECFGRDNLLVPGNELIPNVNGPLASSFNSFKDSIHVIGVAPEFGTVPLQHMLSTLIDENLSWNEGHRTTGERKEIINRMRHYFFPDDTGWADDVWTQFKECLEKSIDYLGNTAPVLSSIE